MLTGIPNHRKKRDRSTMPINYRERARDHTKQFN